MKERKNLKEGGGRECLELLQFLLSLLPNMSSSLPRHSRRSPRLLTKSLGNRPTHFKIEYDSDDEPVIIHQNPFAPKARRDAVVQHSQRTRVLAYMIDLANNAPDQYTRLNATIQFFDEVLRNIDWLKTHDRVVHVLHEKIEEFGEYTSERGNILMYPSECYRLDKVMEHLQKYI